MRNLFLLLFSLCVFFQTHAQDKPDNLSNVGTETRVYDSMAVYTFASEMPSFQTSEEKSFAEYVKKRIVYPKDARELRIEGTVYLQYIIETDGSVSNVSVLPGKGVYPSLDQAAINVIKSSPKWTPGKTNGKPVRVKQIQRITFSLNP